MVTTNYPASCHVPHLSISVTELPGLPNPPGRRAWAGR